MSTITIYTTPTCGFCHMAKSYFKSNNIDYNEKDVSTDVQAAREMIDKSQQRGVPVIDIGGNLVVGFDRPRIDALLRQNKRV